MNLNAIEQNSYFLTFPKEHENTFRDFFLSHKKTGIRRALIVFLIFLTGFITSLTYLLPEAREVPLFAGHFLAVFGLFLGILLTNSDTFAGKALNVLPAVFFISGADLILCRIFIPDTSGTFASAALAILILVVYIFAGVGLIRSLIVGLLLSTGYLLFGSAAGQQQFFDLLILLFSNILGYAAAFNYESAIRETFLNSQSEQHSKKELDLIRLDLEKSDQDFQESLKTNKALQETLDYLKSVEENLNIKLEYDDLLANLASQFIQINPDDTHAMIRYFLRSVGEFAGVERCYIYLFRNNGADLEKRYEWHMTDVKPKIPKFEQVDNEDFSWLTKKIRHNETIRINHLNQFPAEASTLKEIFKVENIQSLLIQPLMMQKKIVGLIGMDTTKDALNWTENHIDWLKRSGMVIVHALQRKISYDQSRQSEEKLRSLFDRSEDVVFISTVEGKILDINPAGAKLFGYDSVEELLKVNIVNDLYDNPAEYLKYQKLLEQYGHIKDYQIVFKHKNGQNITVLETTTAVRDDRGNITTYEGIMRDVTDKRALEQQLFQSQKMESIGLLAGGIAHDFNNILTAINGYADMILKNMDPHHPHYKDVASILRGGKRAEDLTRQLLAFSRKQIIEPKIININDVISDLEKMLYRLIGEDIVLETKLTKNIGLIKADPGQLEQILVNLIVNGRDALNSKKERGIEKKISIVTKQEFLDDRFVTRHAGSKEGSYIVITVTDNGVGMDEETVQKIFEPFYTSKEEGKGTGLGLSTVYGIVKQNNSSIYVNSKLGVGTSFSIYWPLSDQDILPDYSEESSTIDQRAGETIMVVEDDHDVRDLACSFLKSLGYKIYEASNGVEALELIQKNNLIMKIDLLLTDMVMPEMGGDQLAERILGLNPQLKVLLTSGYTDSEILKTGLSSRGYYFLAKPYTIQQISKKVRQALDQPSARIKTS